MELPSDIIRIFILDLVWILASRIEAVKGVMCYCTYADCNAAFCEGDYCLVGFKKDNRANIFQYCATAEISREILGPCKLDFQNVWEDVCKCSKNNCNTYSYYRRAMEAYNQLGTAPENDFPPGGYPTAEEIENNSTNAVGFSNNQLVILLICVPLGVGVVAVVFVFINYHCKL